MSDKTCGTCAIGDDSTVWCAKRGRRVPACHEACCEYEERADSVEQVAREAVCSLVAIGEAHFARGNMSTAQCALDWAKECIDRLNALEVEV